MLKQRNENRQSASQCATQKLAKSGNVDCRVTRGLYFMTYTINAAQNVCAQTVNRYLLKLQRGLTSCANSVHGSAQYYGC
jgi:hypothetical protein